jgi:poly-beta-1,6-N-acetyl-D-glucosamine synthase
MDPAVTIEARINRNRLVYVLITPARNEAAFIELTIQSVIKQTVLPLRWIIVSDGSTDGTDDIVGKYSSQHAWIELLRMPERKERHFGGKVLGFNAGLERLKPLKYDIIGNLDADMSFQGDVFAFLMNKFAENPTLGVAGVPFTEGSGTYDFRFSSVEHVSGACQLFRRECFEAIGGYTPLKGGGIDVVAVLSARMKGWQTRTFPEKVCIHHRTMGTAQHGGAKTSFKLGEKDYSLGRHPLWQTFRAFYQMTRPPLISGGVLLLAGYFWAMMKSAERPLPNELIRFQRHEQMQRLKEFLTCKLLFRKRGSGVSQPGSDPAPAAKAG